jgi:CO/xanthine dehydrogenase FAD-binding subunit
MIPFDFDYFLPETAEEAVEYYLELESEQKKPLYYAGGTEIITMCRQQTIEAEALIDLKQIADTLVFQKKDGQLLVGANLVLNRIVEDNHYPLLSAVACKIADRTVRNRLTLGGNICGRLPYREALLPFLLADAELLLAGPGGMRSEKLSALFDKRLKLDKGEFLLQLRVPEEKLNLSFWTKRREKHGPVDYPLFHLAAVKDKETLNLAVSGLCAFAFRSRELEQLLNDHDLERSSLARKAAEYLPGTIRDDDRGSAAYRRALFEQDLNLLVREMEGR